MVAVVHPRYKALYFEKYNWPEAWRETALALLKEEWDDNYKPTILARPPSPAKKVSSNLFSDVPQLM